MGIGDLFGRFSIDELFGIALGFGGKGSMGGFGVVGYSV